MAIARYNQRRPQKPSLRQRCGHSLPHEPLTESASSIPPHALCAPKMNELANTRKSE